MLEIRRLIETIVKSIADEPDGIYITENDAGDSISYEIEASREDLGKLIGREGRIATSIRNIVKAAGAKHNVKISVSILKEPLESNG